MTIKIKRTLTGVVLFESEAPAGMDSSLHLRYALEKATQSGANLRARIAAMDELRARYLRAQNPPRT